jgi:hypothetical protein
MTTREFINKAWHGTTRTRQCSSVFVDNDGNIYSYGYHYPLLFRVGNKVIRNVKGYSNSTSKHIHWTRDIDAIDVEVPRDFRIGYDQERMLEQLIQGQHEYVTSIKGQMDGKKRKDTQVYRWLEYDYTRALYNLNMLREV